MLLNSSGVSVALKNTENSLIQPARNSFCIDKLIMFSLKLVPVLFGFDFDFKNHYGGLNAIISVFARTTETVHETNLMAIYIFSF